MIRLMGLILFLSCYLAQAQQGYVPVQGEPGNLYYVKQYLQTYHDCSAPGCYGPQMKHQADIAIEFIKQSAASAQPNEKLAIVLDIDETSLSNWSVELHDDFGYVPADSNACVVQLCGKAILSTLRIFQEAQKDKLAVFFITGRPDAQRAATTANLEAEGYRSWQGLALRPENDQKKGSVSDYKSAERKKIIGAGYRIVLNVGDQVSDLIGSPEAEHSVKLPNPFYYIE